MLTFLRDTRDRGIGVVPITHSPHHAHMIGDEFVLLKRGRMTYYWLEEDVALAELAAAMAGAELEDLAHELGAWPDLTLRPSGQVMNLTDTP